MQAAHAASARRRRRAPPDPSISQVAWTLDDAHVRPCAQPPASRFATRPRSTQAALVVARSVV